MTNKIQDAYPLTPTQAGILFHTLGAPGSGQYVVQIEVRLTGDIAPSREQAAWEALVLRHDVLRTACVWEGQKQPLQVVGIKAAPKVTVTDLTAHPSPAAEVDAFLHQDRLEGFELSKAPLLRVRRFELAGAAHRLIVTFHHIVLDGWSIPLLLRDWVALYAGRDLPPAPNFKDYLGWLHHQDKTAARRFWTTELAGLDDVSPLPLPSPKAPVEVQGTCHLNLSVTQTKRLSQLANEQRLTVSTLVHGLWALVLAQYQDSDDVVYGLARAGRPSSLPAASERVGMFLNTLPMRARVTAEASLIDWLGGLQARHLAQQPFEHATLVDVQDAGPLPQGTPLMHSIVVFENYPTDPGLLGQADGLTVDAITVNEQTNFPLALFAQMGEQLELKLLFDPQNICSDAAQRMLDHLQNLFDQLDRAPETALADLSVLGADDTARLLKRGRANTTPPSFSSISEAIHGQPTASLAITGSETLSYAALNAQANRIANHLIARGLPKGGPVGVCLHRGPLIPAALLGILRAGAYYVPLDPTYPQGRLSQIATDSGISIVLCESDTAHICADLGKTALDLTTGLDQSPDTLPDVTASKDDLAYLIYTSGSTGAPKGVPIQHGALVNLLSSFQNRLHLGPGDTWLAVTTLSFDIATLEILLPLVSGATLVSPTDTDVRNPTALQDSIAAHGVTHMQATPSTWRLLFDGGWKGAKLTALCGGEALDPPLAHRLLAATDALWNVYGPTETTIWSTALRLTDEQLAKHQVPIGGAIDNTSLYVCDRLGRLMPHGVPGELCIGGAGLSPGYHGRPDLTDDAFVRFETGVRLYRTGDRVRWRDDGTLDFLGRINTQTKLRGHRIELGEVETALCGHTHIEQAAVVIAGDGPAARLVAFVCEHTSTTDQQLRAHLAHVLPPFMLPATYVRLDAFPQTLNGKIDRKTLATHAQAPKTPALTPEGFDQPMAALASIWCDLLHLDGVAPQDSFFDLGGHSLLLITLQDRIQTDLHCPLEITDLLRFPTLQAQADHISGLQTTTPSTSETDLLEPRIQARATGKNRLQQRRAIRRSQRTEHV